MPTRTNVVQLRPPVLAGVPFSEAQALWDRAEIRACLDALRGNETPESAVLSARCLIRLNQPDDALVRLTAAASRIGACSDRLRGEYALVTALAYSLLGDPESTDAALADSRAYVYSGRDRGLEAELHIIESLVSWSRHDLERARSIAEGVLVSAPTGKWRARALEMLGAAAGTEGKYKSQIDFYERAWSALDEGDAEEPFLRGALLQVLAGLCDDLFRPDLVERLTEREQTLAWTPDTEYMHFTVLRHIARVHALAGDHIRSFRLLRRAAELAPSLPWRIMIFAERSSLACEMNERLFAREELEQALSLAGTHKWSKVRGEERLALLRLSQVTAPTNPSRAEALLDIYRHQLPPIAPTTLAAHDGRMAATEAYTFGIVALHCGDATRAVERLSQAFTLWRSIDYVSRAVDVAIHLARLTGASVFTNYARRHAVSFPNTWLAREARTLSGTS